ncbi:MAG: sigma factor [Pedobacter sp.]|uniref:RNA polymerase sigma factor n=1 Tax=Pedobacter sp. TaxID=1411316 RepID=UPI0035697C1D
MNRHIKISPDINITDQELLLLIKENDYAAFDKLYGRHWRSVYDVAYKRLKDQNTSKDIVQDIFVDLWDKRKSKQIIDLVPYLHTAVRYKIYSLLAKNKATPHFVEPGG